VTRDVETGYSTIVTRVRVPVTRRETVREVSSSTSTVFDSSSTLSTTATYGTKQVGSINVSGVSPNQQYTISRVGYAYSTQNTSAGGASKLLVGATLDPTS